MGHRLHAGGGRPIYAWCTLDPFLIVPLIERPATVESKDRITGEPATIHVTPSGLEDPQPVSAAISLLRPDNKHRSRRDSGAASPIDKLAPRVIMASREQRGHTPLAPALPAIPVAAVRP